MTHELVSGYWLRSHVLAPLARDKTFAEVGGLWDTVNETVSVALRAGAREASMIDITAPGTELWKRFEKRCADLDVQPTRCITADLCCDSFAEQVGQYDVTHCAGVLYHTPDPVRAISNLVAITRERFMLTSATVPSIIENRAGRITLGSGQCLFVPAMSNSDLAVLREHFRERRTRALGITAPGQFVRSGRPRGAPWWWLFSSETLIGMCKLFDVEIERTWEHRKPGQRHIGGATVLARVNPASVSEHLHQPSVGGQAATVRTRRLRS